MRTCGGVENMIKYIVISRDGVYPMEHICYIVGAAPLDGRLPAVKSGDCLIAADAGFSALQAAGLSPDLVIGDFDSLGDVPDHPNVLTHSPIKDDTDLILALRWALERGWRRFEIYGALGGARLDQTVASFQTLRGLRAKEARAILVGDGWNVTVIDHCRLRFPPEAKGRLAVFCAGSPCAGVTLRGLKYTLEDSVLTGFYPLGVSNEFIGEAAEIAVRKGMLYVLWQDETRPEEETI